MYYKNEISPVLKSPKKSSLYYDILDTRGSKKSYLEVKIKENGKIKWVFIYSYIYIRNETFNSFFLYTGKG